MIGKRRPVYFSAILEYKNLTLDLGLRTLEILKQYEAAVPLSSDASYEVTLLINCLLALIVLPKEKGGSFLPSKPISSLSEWGISRSVFALEPHKTVKELVERLRGGVAHLAVDFEVDADQKIEFLIIKDDDGRSSLAKFHVSEIKPFLENLYKEWSEIFRKHSPQIQ